MLNLIYSYYFQLGPVMLILHGTDLCCFTHDLKSGTLSPNLNVNTKAEWNKGYIPCSYTPIIGTCCDGVFSASSEMRSPRWHECFDFYIFYMV